ncbi:hypothetical protein LY78DRAFT_653304 [Colletotrichum sublineola]|nr:hypothetical protein LY78DRAFT_653304 [Colletotrichum sublineola]
MDVCKLPVCVSDWLDFALLSIGVGSIGWSLSIELAVAWRVIRFLLRLQSTGCMRGSSFRPLGLVDNDKDDNRGFGGDPSHGG